MGVLGLLAVSAGGSLPDESFVSESRRASELDAGFSRLTNLRTINKLLIHGDEYAGQDQ